MKFDLGSARRSYCCHHRQQFLVRHPIQFAADWLEEFEPGSRSFGYAFPVLIKSVRVGENVDDTQLGLILIEVLEKGKRAGFFRLDKFYHLLGVSLQTFKFAFLDFEVADENDGSGNGSLLSSTRTAIFNLRVRRRLHNRAEMIDFPPCLGQSFGEWYIRG